jgi:DNA modification methylase
VELKILPDIRKLLFPLREEELKLLKESIKKEGIRDPLFGSGTTAVACKETKRRFVGAEASQEMFGIAKARLS